MREPAADHTPEQQQLLADIAESGVHIVHVEVDDGATYSYTVGLWERFEQPEVIVFGLPDDVAGDLLDTVADEVAEGRKFRAGEKHDGLLVGYPARFFDVPKALLELLLPDAVWAYQDTEFPCVQLVWPDKQGRWPWEPGVRDGFAAAQPVPGRPAP
ncbi:MAG: DUF4262 domain-containing protein [Planctomycetes bacterium]|jgi:hypothetical protein|nr:DUF4262 domain-containing protein [Planctomycetota bacterium]